MASSTQTVDERVISTLANVLEVPPSEIKLGQKVWRLLAKLDMDGDPMDEALSELTDEFETELKGRNLITSDAQWFLHRRPGCEHLQDYGGVSLDSDEYATVGRLIDFVKAQIEQPLPVTFRDMEVPDAPGYWFGADRGTVAMFKVTAWAGDPKDLRVWLDGVRAWQSIERIRYFYKKWSGPFGHPQL